MRVGLLSQPNLIKVLNSEFVNSWVVLSQLEKPEKYFTTEIGRTWAKAVLKKYDYPVQTQILSPKGELLAELPAMANFTMKPGPGPAPEQSPYQQSLDKALEALKKK